jgi:hypothetical protein
METPISIINCPSRRPAIAYPYSADRPGWSYRLLNAALPTLVGRLDYAINGGDFLGPQIAAWPPNTPENVVVTPFPCRNRLGDLAYEGGPCGDYSNELGYRSPLLGDSGINGVSFNQSEVGIRHILDGASNTYLIGEKHVPTEQYEEYRTLRMDSWITGSLHISRRWAEFPPAPDTVVIECTLDGSCQGGEAGVFGSAHPSSFHMALCDGSVRSVDYDIDVRVHQAGANRKDGMVHGQ